MTKVERVKEVVKDHIDEARCGIFNCKNIAGDDMTTLFGDAEVQVDICYDWAYFEVFGLTEKEFNEVYAYYRILLGEDDS